MAVPAPTRPAPTPVLIFDIGNVFVRHDNNLLFDRLAACCADPVGVRPRLAAGLHDNVIATGRLGIDALHGQLVAEHGFSQPYGHFLDLWSSHFSEEPGMEALVRVLAQRHRIALFSNINAPHWEHVSARYTALAHAHAAYLSYQLGLVKPDPASFRRVLELEGCAPEDSIFIDDRAENTAAATSIGMRSVTFTDRAALVTALAAYGVATEGL
ncbi:MAG TPA: HAD-IA family hydrolase [Stellaceae bacterium]|nr:HAD-IA family hydrolase [Stellaceae bacterium]